MKGWDWGLLALALAFCRSEVKYVNAGAHVPAFKLASIRLIMEVFPLYVPPDADHHA